MSYFRQAAFLITHSRLITSVNLCNISIHSCALCQKIFCLKNICVECVDSIVQTWVMVELMLLLKEVFSNFKILYIPLRGAKGLGNLFFGAFLHKQTQFLPKIN